MSENMPLLLLPGLLCDAALWRHQTRFLEGIADCHVAGIAGHDRIEAIARDVLAKAPPRFALAGLSMGGYVAFEILRQAPERVLRLCLLDTSARPDTGEQREKRRLLLVMAKTGHFKGVTPRLLPLLIHPDRLKECELTDAITAMAERMGRDAFQKQQAAIMHRIDSRPLLKSIACPAQIIGGRQDALTPPDIVREIAEGMPNARFDIIEDCGHLAPLEKPDEVNRLMRRWLESQGRF
jgi:pimeloyl-ACP methyl ester carboxylesterase